MHRNGKGSVATIRPGSPVRRSCARAAVAQHGPWPGSRALVFCKRGLGFLNNHAEQQNTITTDSRFTLKTLECVAFAMGRSSACPRMTAWDTDGNGGYAGPTSLATTEVRG